MIMPYIEEQQTSADMISEFRGYNHNPVIGDNEFFDMENMTGDRYPLASVRDKRGVMELDIDGVLLGLEGKDKPLVLWSDNKDALPSDLYTSLYSIAETGDGATIFDKAVTAAATSNMGEGVYAFIAPANVRLRYPIFDEVSNDSTLVSLTIFCLDYIYSGIGFNDVEVVEEFEDYDIVRSDALDKINRLITGAEVYLCGENETTRMRSTPLHIKSVGAYRQSASLVMRSCEIYFDKSEVQAQGLLDKYGQDVYDEIGESFVLALQTDGIIPTDKNYGGTGYIAFYNPNTNQLENTTSIGTVSAGEKQFVSMGANVIIFPEKKIINTLKITTNQFSDIQPLEQSFTSQTATAYSSQPTASSGTTLPTSPTDGQYFWDTSGEIAVLKQYSEALGRWATQATYLWITGISDHGFKKGDAIKIANSAIASHIPSGQKNFVIESVETSSIKIQCNFTSPFTASNLEVTLSRVLPEMDFIIECNNRLWGCHYGLNANNEMVNEIFASKLGDPFNWYYFTNTSIDSYYVSLGSEGAFTGAVNYQSTPTFFKADVIHRIVGDYPAQYQLKTIEGYGVRPGCNKSISVMNDIVYYLSPVGMVVFNGGIPVSLAVPFGEVRYDKCISGDIGNKLYCSMHDEFDKWSMFVYDDSNGLWHREDSLHAEDFGIYNGELLCVSKNKLYSLGGVYGDKEPDFEWMLQTGDMGYMSPLRKTIRRIVLRIKLAITSRARIEIQYDNDGIWRPVNELRPSGEIRSYAVPIKPFRCDHYSIRIKGKGEFNLQAITRHWAEGSELD